MPYKDPKKRARFHRAYYRKHRADLLAYWSEYHKKHSKRYYLRQQQWRKDHPTE